VPISFVPGSGQKSKRQAKLVAAIILIICQRSGNWREDVFTAGNANANGDMTTEFSRIPADAERFVCCGQAEGLNIALPYWFGPLPRDGQWVSGALGLSRGEKAGASHMIYEWQLTRRALWRIDKRLLATNRSPVFPYPQGHLAAIAKSLKSISAAIKSNYPEGFRSLALH